MAREVGQAEEQSCRSNGATGLCHSFCAELELDGSLHWKHYVPRWLNFLLGTDGAGHVGTVYEPFDGYFQGRQERLFYQKEN